MTRVQGIIVSILAVILVGMIIAGVCILPGMYNEGGFVPPEADPTAVAFEEVPDVSQRKYGYAYLPAMYAYAGSSLQVLNCYNVYVQDGKADIWLTVSPNNPAWVLAELYSADGNTLLGKTGYIQPGQYVQSVAMNQPITGNSKAKMKLITYKPEDWTSMGTIELEISISPVGIDLPWADPAGVVTTSDVPEAVLPYQYEKVSFTGSEDVGLCKEVTVDQGCMSVWLAAQENFSGKLKAEVYDDKGNLLITTPEIKAGEYVEGEECDFVPEEPVKGKVKLIETESGKTMEVEVSIAKWESKSE